MPWLQALVLASSIQASSAQANGTTYQTPTGLKVRTGCGIVGGSNNPLSQ